MHRTNPLTIFYTDDDADDRAFFREVLEEVDASCRLYEQAHGQELLEQLRHPPPEPHVVFLDLNMPVKNGFDTLMEMRSSEKYKDVPVVIFTTADDDESVDKARRLGADMFITKPRAYSEFKKAVQETLSKNWAQHPSGSRPFEHRTL